MMDFFSPNGFQKEGYRIGHLIADLEECILQDNDTVWLDRNRENSICKRTRKLCPYQTQECLNQANILLIEADALHFFSNHLKLLTK